jgi:cell division protein FtsI (penicillin-binding protein 3)
MAIAHDYVVAVSRRAKIAAFCVSGGFLVLLLRLFYIQGINHPYYQEKALQQHWAKVPLPAQRGEIRDRHGLLLAVSQESYSFYADPKEVKDAARVAQQLSPMFAMTEQELLPRLTHPARRFVWLKRQLPRDKAEAVKKLKFAGIYERKEPRRIYPHGKLASHVLGFVSVDQEGLEGIEAGFNTELSGQDGFLWNLKDGRLSRLGIYSPEAPEVKPRDGATVYLTIVARLQYVLETELQKALDEYPSLGAAGVLLDVASGEILAMASLPDFDPNDFLRYDRNTWRNRAVSNAYEQGSVMKPFIIAAALAEKLVTPDTTFFCHHGACRIIPGRVLHDSHPYGTLTVEEIIIKSSNIGTALVGMELGSERLCRYLEHLGFGRKTNIGLPGEATGLMKPAERWSNFTLTSVPMGHEICLTPLQMAAAYTTLAGDGIYRPPSIVKKLHYPGGKVLYRYQPPELRRIYPADTVAKMQKMLRLVVASGTAQKANLKMVAVAGKTGTAQKLDEHGQYSHTKYISVFAGFAPAENPQYCCLLMLDEPQGAYYGGTVAAPAAGRILQQICLHQALLEEYERNSVAKSH